MLVLDGFLGRAYQLSGRPPVLQFSLAPSLAERLAHPKLDFRRLATRIISEPQLIQSLFDIIQSS
jgi:hypothetical protein